MMIKKTQKDIILILSCEKDFTAQEVTKQIQERDVPAFLLDTGDFPTHVTLSASCDGEEWQGSIFIGEEQIPLERIKSILYRRPTHYQVDSILPTQVQYAAENECSRGFGGVLR